VDVCGLVAIIFSETGFVVTPFLPGTRCCCGGGVGGDAGSPLSVAWLLGCSASRAISGNTVNYSVGRLFGDKLAANFPRIIKPRYLEKTHAFYEKYGGETIIITRFVPIVRTLRRSWPAWAHDVSEIHGLQRGGRFALGGAIAVCGYWFGQLEFVKTHFGIVELAIIFISVLPMVIEFLRHRGKV